MVVHAEPRSACPELRSTCPDLIGRDRAHRAHPCPPKSLPYNLFADPHPLTVFASIFYKNIGWHGRIMFNRLSCVGNVQAFKSKLHCNCGAEIPIRSVRFDAFCFISFTFNLLPTLLHNGHSSTPLQSIRYTLFSLPRGVSESVWQLQVMARNCVRPNTYSQYVVVATLKH